MLEFRNKIAVKICGLTRRDDALCCAGEGVEIFGLNFSPQSARCVSVRAAEEIISSVRTSFSQTKFVGIFVDQPVPQIQTIARQLQLDAVQLHGSESMEDARALSPLFVIKAFRVGPTLDAAGAAAYPCDAHLFDTWTTRAPGGSGETFPWSIAAGVRLRVRFLILAGGLTNKNVTDAIRLVRPDAVDVCSGVEEEPGRKNPTLVRQFVAAVRGVGALS